MTFEIKQVWKDVELTVVNDYGRVIGSAPANLYSNEVMVWTTPSYPDLKLGQKWTHVITEQSLKSVGIKVGDRLKVAPHMEWDWSNEMIYQALAVPAEVIIIPAEIIIGVAMIKFIK